MSYEAAPATRLLATACAICGRPLVDAESVESGIGPVCAERYEYAAGKSEANALVYEVAARQKESWLVLKPLIERIAALGYAVLAERLAERLTPEPEIFLDTVGSSVRVLAPYSAGAIADLRGIKGRYFRKEVDADTGEERAYNFVPVSARAALWALLKKHYAGRVAKSAQGIFEIPAE